MKIHHMRLFCAALAAVVFVSGYLALQSAAAAESSASMVSEAERIKFEKTDEIPFRYTITIPAGLDKSEQVYIQLLPSYNQTASNQYGRKNALELRAISLSIDFSFKAGEVGDEPLSASGAFFIQDFYWKEGEEFYGNFYRSEIYRQPHKLFERIIDQTVDYLTAKGFTVDRRVLIDGFSTDGFFAQHFAVMSPAYVRAIIAGSAVVLMLPFEEIGGFTLKYPLGTADYAQAYIDGDAWDKEAYMDIDQLIYIADVDQVCDGISDMLRFEEDIRFIVNQFGVLVPERLYRQVRYMQENGFENTHFLLFQGDQNNTHFPLPSDVRFNFLLASINGSLEENRDQYQTPDNEIANRLAAVSVEASGWQKELREYLTGLLE